MNNLPKFSYKYPTLESGTLIKRYKRFLADIELKSGEIITAHCANTGPMKGVCTSGSPVMVSHSNNPKRKLAYTWELIQVTDNEPTWVGINTALPNRIIKLALAEYLFPELGDYREIKPEVVYGKDKKSRVDFKLITQSQNIYLEVKNTTWANQRIALFPDTVTERGQKHLRELIEVVKKGERAVCLFFINRGDCYQFSPGDIADPDYGQLLREAVKKGVEILPCRFEVTPQEIRYLGMAEFIN
ncbi:DNA/RNA nuclease SfsA [Okeania sp. KiyG1]|uniref:DNA/RNA nuclease SfsA n=1 Tax=Okeania sp. KiyG1 TaxID=2720165 RepID=UPI0019242837|nr:DNA/RNA nuclease SfsA [Okeania sp. KiyG1]GGA33081.1 sugar fermentation stimulation protein [Okeania sp. KiyG1]